MKHGLKYLLLLVIASTTVYGGKTETLRNGTGKPVRYAGRLSAEPVVIPATYTQKNQELRGIWVATVDNIDFNVHDNADTFRKDYIEILNNLRGSNFNAIFFQVRPMNDAFYPSAYNPWSRFLAGSEGRPIANFDPMAFMVTEAKKRGIQFHAWLNPYRVAKGLERGKTEYLKSLDHKNFARRNPSLVLEVEKDGKRLLILDPGDPLVVKFVINSVQEIIQNYDVDGIHFDDYFYPYGGCGNVDSRTFARNNPRKIAREDWRRENVNNLIRGVKKAIDAHNTAKKRQVQFGISPFGIWQNYQSDKRGSLTSGSESYSNQHADSLYWIRSGLIDYIVPQIYWHFEHDVAAYAAVTDWWVNAVKGTRVNLYIGHAPAFCGVNPGWNSNIEIPNQLRYNSKHPEIKGEVMFSYKSFARPGNKCMRRNTEAVYKSLWTKPASHPPCGPYRSGAITPAEPKIAPPVQKPEPLKRS